MYRDYRIVAFTPSGRKRTQSILLDNLSRFTDIVDEYQVWLNTDDSQVEDTKWLRGLPDTYDWVKLVERPKGVQRLSPKQMNTGYFYVNTTDENTIYIRFDDDIVYIDDNFFTNLLDFRIDNPDYFLVMANIWNNAVVSYIQQALGNISEESYKVEDPYCMDPVGWRNPHFAELIHRQLIDNIKSATTSTLLFDRADLTDAGRFSISCFCFFGKDFAKFKGIVGQRREGIIRHDEEVWLTEIYPTLEDRLNTICGSALVAHYSFFAQRPHLDTTDILQTYKEIGKSKLSESYYDLLDENKKLITSNSIELKTVVLPKVNYASTYSDAIRAERAGYEVNILGDTHVQIWFNGNLVKEIIGNKITERNIDDALGILYRSNPKLERDRQDTASRPE